MHKKPTYPKLQPGAANQRRRYDYGWGGGGGGVSKALAVAQRRNVLLWASIPCTGGSPWQRITKRLASARLKIAAHIELFKKLWVSFVTVAEMVLSHGGVVAIEWPQQCAYWEREEVKTFLVKHNLVRSIFHGCAYGLVSKATSTLGLPIKKPWVVATNSGALRAVLNRHCSKDHEHIQCGGSDLRKTEEYTDEMVDVIHNGFITHLRSAARVRVPALCANVCTLGPNISSPRLSLVSLRPRPGRHAWISSARWRLPLAAAVPRFASRPRCPTRST